MFNNPTIDDPTFQALKVECYKRFLRLMLAKNNRAYHDMGGNYAAYCHFSSMQVCVGESLQDIADFLKIGGVYD